MEVVYEIVRRIPKGRATSYGAIAEASGIRLTARMVGWAMNAAGRAKPAVPAHRVVNSKGELSGRSHFSTPTLMQELLEQEGIRVKNDKIEDFDRVFWDPAEGKNTALKPKAAKTKVKEKAAKAVASPSKVKPTPKAKSASKPANMAAAKAQPGTATKRKPVEKPRSTAAPASLRKPKPTAKRKPAAKTPGPPAPKIKKEK